MSLLTMIRNVCQEMGMTAPTAILTATDRQTLQMLRLVYRTGEELRARVDWPELLTEADITLATDTPQYAYPSDLDRVIYETEWKGTDTWPLIGPLSPQEYEARVRGISSVTEYDHFIAKGSSTAQFTIFPTPDAADDGKHIYFLYQSNKWTLNSGTASATFQADAATSIIDEGLVELGVMWRYKAQNGMEYQEDKAQYYALIPIKATAKKSARRLSLRGTKLRRFITTANVPEGNW